MQNHSPQRQHQEAFRFLVLQLWSLMEVLCRLSNRLGWSDMVEGDV
jgi:hypothetical protein